MRRVVITGLGVVAPNGVGKDAFWQACVDGHSGIGPIRSSAVSGEPRAPYCMMGVCFECLVEIDGLANRQACMVRVRPGMQVMQGRTPHA